MNIYAKKVLTPGGFLLDGVVTVEDGRILSITHGESGDLSCDVLAPGWFDVHCHGGEGFYALTPDEEHLRAYLLKLASCGVTDILLSLSTYMGKDGYRSALDFARNAMRMQAAGELPGANIAGIHMEGPFLSPFKCGAMNPDAMLQPDVATFREYFGDYEDMIRLVTIAPEREGSRELAAYLCSKGIQVQAGHTNATYEEAEEAFRFGVTSMCHTFNAARPIHHRDPGILVAALTDPGIYCEAICDLKHLHGGTLRMIYQLKGRERMMIISDSVASTGLPDGRHVINGHEYLIVNGTTRVKGGETLSGGACYINGGVQSLLSLGIPQEDVLYMASTTPANRIGLTDIGRIAPGAKAHLVGLNRDLKPVFTLIGENCNQNETKEN